MQSFIFLSLIVTNLLTLLLTPGCHDGVQIIVKIISIDEFLIPKLVQVQSSIFLSLLVIKLLIMGHVNWPI